MLTSLHRVLTQISLPDTGLPQQVEIFRQVREKTGRIPPVVDARDVLQNPRRMLSRLCEALEVPFVDDMLEWPAGPARDGWYVGQALVCQRRENLDLRALSPQAGQLARAA